MHENYDFFYGLEAELEELTETHNYIAGNIFYYMKENRIGDCLSNFICFKYRIQG